MTQTTDNLITLTSTSLILDLTKTAPNNFFVLRLYYIRADVLRDKQNALKKSKEEKRHESISIEMNEDNDSDSDDLEDMFNWRAKKAL